MSLLEKSHTHLLRIKTDFFVFYRDSKDTSIYVKIPTHSFCDFHSATFTPLCSLHRDNVQESYSVNVTCLDDARHIAAIIFRRPDFPFGQSDMDEISLTGTSNFAAPDSPSTYKDINQYCGVRFVYD